MVPPPVPGEPRKAPKPEPIGNMAYVSLITTCTLCLLFILYRRAGMLRKVVSHRLKTFTTGTSGGHIRLSEDDGPSSTEFIGDDYDDDNEQLHTINPESDTISEHMKRVTNAWREPNVAPLLQSSTSTSSTETPAAVPAPALLDLVGQGTSEPIIRL